MVEQDIEKKEGRVDLLWRRLRSMADRLIERRAGRGGVDPRVRGEMYLFIVDRIARWVDRIEQNDASADAEAVKGMLRAGMDEIRDRLNGHAPPGSATP
jgi:hypothetical protein